MKRLIIIAGVVASVMTLAVPVRAQTSVRYTPQVTIPGGPEGIVTGNTLAIYIKALYEYGVGIIGIVAAVVIMAAGVMWLLAGGNVGRVEEAKAWIQAAIIGLILALLSYTILLTVNPDLIAFEPITITKITKPTPQEQAVADYFEQGADVSVERVLGNLEEGTTSGYEFNGVFQSSSNDAVMRLTVREDGSFALYETPEKNFLTGNINANSWTEIESGGRNELYMLTNSVLPATQGDNSQYQQVYNELTNFMESVNE